MTKIAFERPMHRRVIEHANKFRNGGRWWHLNPVLSNVTQQLRRRSIYHPNPTLSKEYSRTPRGPQNSLAPYPLSYTMQPTLTIVNCSITATRG